MTGSTITRVKISEVRFIQMLIERARLDERCILAAARLPEDLFLQADETTISFRDFFRLMEELTDAAGDETVTASARRLRPGTAQLIVSGVVDGSSLEDAMVHIAHAYNVVHAGDYNSVISRKDQLYYCIDDRGFPFSINNLGATRHAFMESVLLFLQALLSELAGENLTPHVLRIDTRRPRREPEHDAFLTCWPAPIRCGASTYGIRFSPKIAHLPVRSAARTDFARSPVYRVVAQRIADMFDANASDQRHWTARSRQALHLADLDQAALADHVGVSVATLRRNLAMEGSSFRDIKTRLRHVRAKHLLACGHTVQEVAELLNYSDARAFSRAFKAQQGSTPSAFQRGVQKVIPS